MIKCFWLFPLVLFLTPGFGQEFNFRLNETVVIDTAFNPSDSTVLITLSTAVKGLSVTLRGSAVSLNHYEFNKQGVVFNSDSLMVGIDDKCLFLNLYEAPYGYPFLKNVKLKSNKHVFFLKGGRLGCNGRNCVGESIWVFLVQNDSIKWGYCMDEEVLNISIQDACVESIGNNWFIFRTLNNERVRFDRKLLRKSKGVAEIGHNRNCR